MDQHEKPPAFDLLLGALAMVLVILVGLVVLRQNHAWPWAQDAAAYAPTTSYERRAPPPPRSTSCIAEHSCLVEGLRCADAALVCSNHFWTSL